MITSGLNVLTSGGGFTAAIMVTLQKSSVKFGNVSTNLKQKTFQISECELAIIEIWGHQGHEGLFKHKFGFS
jgi:hypothetical protein